MTGFGHNGWFKAPPGARVVRHAVSDPWIANPESDQPVHESALFLCAHTIFTPIGPVSEALFMGLYGCNWRLWVVGGFEEASGRSLDELDKVTPEALNRWDCIWRGAAQITIDRPHFADTALKLMTNLVDERSPYGWPTKLQRIGVLSEIEYWNWRDQTTRPFRRARGAYHLVQESRHLGLEPVVDRHAARFWSARCPEAGHDLQLDLERGEFACRHCRVRGDRDGLQAYAGLRREFDQFQESTD